MIQGTIYEPYRINDFMAWAKTYNIRYYVHFLPGYCACLPRDSVIHIGYFNLRKHALISSVWLMIISFETLSDVVMFPYSSKIIGNARSMPITAEHLGNKQNEIILRHTYYKTSVSISLKGIIIIPVCGAIMIYDLVVLLVWPLKCWLFDCNWFGI